MQSGSFYTGFTWSCKGLAVVLVGGYVSLQIFPSILPYVALLSRYQLEFFDSLSCSKNTYMLHLIICICKSIFIYPEYLFSLWYFLSEIHLFFPGEGKFPFSHPKSAPWCLVLNLDYWVHLIDIERKPRKRLVGCLVAAIMIV